jgi:hypothetical protein
MSSSNKSIGTQQFIEALYLALLRRRADRAGLAGRLKDPMTTVPELVAVIESFMKSTEFAGRLPQIVSECGIAERFGNEVPRLTIFSIGLPGAFADLCEAAAIFAAGSTYAGVEVLSANSPYEVGVHSLKSKAGCVMVCSRQPNRHVLQALSASERPFIVSSEDPRTAVAYLVRKVGFDIPKALRVVGSSFAALMRFTDLPNALVLDAASAGDERRLVTRIVDHLGLKLSSEQLNGVIRSLHATGRDLTVDWLSPWWDELDPAEQALIDGAVTPYLDLLKDPDADAQFTWGRELFLRSDDPSSPLTEPIDITGRARCLSHGPALVLPPGTWTARVVVGFSREAVGMTFVIEAFLGSPIGQTRLQPKRAGILQADINFTIDRQSPSCDQPFQIRLLNERAAFDGRLAIGDVTLTRQTKVKPEVERELSDVLHLIPATSPT